MMQLWRISQANANSDVLQSQSLFSLLLLGLGLALCLISSPIFATEDGKALAESANPLDKDLKKLKAEPSRELAKHLMAVLANQPVNASTPEAYLQIGEILRNSGDSDAALASLKKVTATTGAAIKIAPSQGHQIFRTAINSVVMMYKMGEKEAAKDSADDLEPVTRSFPEVRQRAGTKFALAGLHAFIKDKEGALRLYALVEDALLSPEGLQSIEPNQLDYAVVQIAAYRFESGHAKEAREILARFEPFIRNHPDIRLIHLYRCLNSPSFDGKYRRNLALATLKEMEDKPVGEQEMDAALNIGSTLKDSDPDRAKAAYRVALRHIDSMKSKSAQWYAISTILYKECAAGFGTESYALATRIMNDYPPETFAKDAGDAPGAARHLAALILCGNQVRATFYGAKYAKIAGGPSGSYVLNTADSMAVTPDMRKQLNSVLRLLSH